MASDANSSGSCGRAARVLLRKIMSNQRVNIAIEWRSAPHPTRIEIVRGRIAEGRVARGTAHFCDSALLDSSGPVRLELAIDADGLGPGANATIVRVRADGSSFSFLLRDVSQTQPIVIPPYGVAVTTQEDRRSFESIRDDI